jgi:mannosyltransferase
VASLDMGTRIPQPTGNDQGDGHSRGVGTLRRYWWALPPLVMLALGGYQVTRPALWADELATWGAVRLSWSQLFRLLGNVDAVVGPYLVGMKAWTGVAGTSTLALRLPSLLAMVAAAGLLTLLAARLAGPSVGLLAGLAFVLVPTTSRYAQEARPYAFAILFAILATLALAWLLDRPGWARAAAYGGTVVLLGAAHLIAVLLLVGHGVVVAMRRDRALLLRWAVAGAVALLILAPLAWLGHRQSGQISWLAPATWRDLVATPDTIFGTGVVGGFLVALGALAAPPGHAAGRVPVRCRPGTALLALSWAVAPILALFLISEVSTLFWARYLLFTLPGFVLLAALTLGRAGSRRAAALLVVLGLLAAPGQTAVRTPDGHNHATTQAAGIIAANEQPGDGIAYALNEPVVPWEARDIVARYVPAARRPRDVFAVTPQRVDGHLTAIECADLAGCLSGTTRLWVLRYQNLADPLTGLGQPKEDLLRSRYRLAKLWLVRGLTVALYLPVAPAG